MRSKFKQFGLALSAFCGLLLLYVAAGPSIYAYFSGVRTTSLRVENVQLVDSWVSYGGYQIVQEFSVLSSVQDQNSPAWPGCQTCTKWARPGGTELLPYVVLDRFDRTRIVCSKSDRSDMPETTICVDLITKRGVLATLRT